MCDEALRGKEHSTERADGYHKFYTTSSFITKKSFLRFIKGNPREEYIPSWPETNQCVYPKANAYYAFHEDTNPFTRFPSTCLSRKYGSVKPHFESPKEPYAIRDPYVETEAKTKYLGSEPACFVVLGKPDLTTAKLASIIAESWNCVLISPLYLINQEIQQDTEKGKIMSDILKTGDCLGPEIVMNLIHCRLNKRDVFHKGYIVEGLPLIPNEVLDYSFYATSPNEESNIQRVSQNLIKFFNSSSHRICNTVTETEENYKARSCKTQDSSISPEQKSAKKHCVMKPNYERFIISQVEDIFATWPIKPSVIIYAMCPDADVRNKREHFRIDPITGRVVDTSLVGMSTNIEILFSQDKMQSDMNVPYELYQELMNEERILDEYQIKYLLRRLCNREQNVKAQCRLYKHFAMPAIEKWILLHNPQNVIRVDCRAPVSLMFRIVISRLRTLTIPRVILPKIFLDHTALEFEGESPEMPVPVDEFQDKSNEEAFQDLANRATVSPLHPWRLSTWNFLCPVELAKGKTVEGIPNCAVRFMNNIFFLSSNEAVDLFLENPRTFLFPFSPRPTCKIVVFGPKYSGKSELCKNLARALGGTVINVDEIEKSRPNIESNISFGSLNSTPLNENSIAIARAIQNLPKEEVDTEVWRDGGYIVDGMCPDIDYWKTLVEESSIIVEDAIVLFDEEPHEYLLSKWRKEQSKKCGEELEEEYMVYCEEEDGEDEMQGINRYLRHIEMFELKWNALKETVSDTCRHLIPCDISKIRNVSEYVISQIEDRYSNKARIMSDEEKEREKDLAEYISMADGTENVGEEEDEEEGESQTMDLDFKENNRRFGDTNYYCPVALLKHSILWKGKDDYSGIFMDKIYLLSSSEALEEFTRSPQKLGLPLRKPLSTIPPFRVGLIGPPGSGKSTLANEISREYGLTHIDYFHCFTSFMKSRGMPAITRDDSIVSPEDLLDDVELPEDLNDERYNSDAATTQTFVRQYWRTGNILPEKIRHECLLQFFKGLYNQHGLLLEQFPSCPQDVDTALKNYAMPEVIIELRCSRGTAVERIMPRLIKSWENKLEEKKGAEELRYTEALEDYERRCDNWVRKMLDKSIGQRHVQEDENENEYPYANTDDDDDETLMEEYVPNDDLDSEEAELRIQLQETWYRENPAPEPVFTDWENVDAAKQRIEQDFQKMYENDTQKIDATRSALENESIPCVVVDGEGNPKNILLQVMRICYPYIQRDVSIVEKTYAVDPETADSLLDCGYFLLSSFGYWCPVQLHRNTVPLQMFHPLEVKQDIYPIIYRQFIFFLGGKDAQSVFSRNPIPYIEQDSCLPIIPFRLSIIGPPKCGKTTLARRFASKYDIKVITRGAALRHVQKHFPWTDTARSAESRLRAGHVVPEESVHGAVEMYSIDPSSISQGFVLDGFPSNRKEFEGLTFLGLQPMITIDLKANLIFCLDCLSNEVDEIKKPPNFSREFLEHRYITWQGDQRCFRDWLKKFTQNVIELDATMSKWYVWLRADEEVCSRYMNIRSYFRECDYDKVHSLKYMNVSPYEFKRRQSQFEAYCPLCLYYEETMETSGPPPASENLVQFRQNFYWICSRHMNDFVLNPQKHLPPLNTAYLQKERPRILTETVDLEHPCWAKRLQVGGFCLVTYVENLPNRKLVHGKSTIGIIYKDNMYIFCTAECRDRFMAQPDKYAKVNINFLHAPLAVNVQNFPNLGFLEQTVAAIIIKAVNQISVIRPKMPGLSPSSTAAIYIGVYLKSHNTHSLLNETKCYQIVDKRICSHERILEVATRTMKKKLNPFVRVPVYKNPVNLNYKLSGRLSMISQIFASQCTSIVFRRTSPTQILSDPSEESVN